MFAFLPALTLAQGARETFGWESRYTATLSQIDYVSHSVDWNYASSLWEVGSAARMAHSDLNFNSLEYKIEAHAGPKPMSAVFRLQHTLAVLQRFSTSQALIGVQTSLKPFSFLRFFGTFGWYERLRTLENPLMVPTFSGHHEHDFAVEVGFQVWLDILSLCLKLATFENISIYNLNNPFLEARLEVQSQNRWSAFGILRNKLLLGFGRTDELMTGIGINWLL